MKRIVYSILGVLVSLFALTSVASLGSYTNQSTNNLMETQAKLDALQRNYDQLKAENAALNNDHAQLQADYAQLQADHEKLGQDYQQSQSELAAANSQIAALTADLKTAKDQNQVLQKKLDSARTKAEILVDIFDDNTSWNALSDRIRETGNRGLLNKWKAVRDNKSFVEFLVSLAEAIVADVK